jgi:NTE family protein
VLRKNAISLILVAGFLLAADTLSLKQEKSVTIGLALSGGAALGLAHIGVLKVLEREGIEVSCISGNSMGALVGGVYAAGYTAAEIESIALAVNWPEMFSPVVSYGAQYLPERQLSQRYALELRHQNLYPLLPSGLLSLQNVELLLMRLLAPIEYNTYYDFDSLPIPYRAVAVDLVSGNRLVFDRGQLSQAIRASIAIPGVFPPVRKDGMELVDGGVQQYLPVDPLYDLQPDVIIAVLTMKRRSDSSSSLIDIVWRSVDLVNVEDLWLQRNLADIVIEPDVDSFLHSDFSKARELIRAGEVAAEAMLPQIRQKIAGRAVGDHRKKIAQRQAPIVRSCRVEGLKVTGESMVKRAMKTKAGKPLDFSVLQGDIVRIYNYGLFENVSYRVGPGIMDSVDLVIVAQEKPYGFYLLGIRYDNFDNVNLGIEAGQGNIGGSGASVRAAAALGNPNELRLGITGTRVFTLPLGYRLDGFLGEEEHDFIYGGADSTWFVSYRIRYQGGVAEVGYILGKNAFFNIGMKTHHVRNEFPPLAVFDPMCVDEWVIGPKFSIEYNDMDDLYLPTKGIVYKGMIFYSSEQLMASEEFLKIQCSLERSYPFSRWLVFHAGVDLGMNLLGTPCWSEYFRTGGESFIGFDKDEFTTKNKAIAKAGLDWRLLNLFDRYDYPLYLELLGNVGTFAQAETVIKETDVRLFNWGAGIGLKTKTPVGPARLVLGLGDYGETDRSLQLRFWISVGKDFRYQH